MVYTLGSRQEPKTPTGQNEMFQTGELSYRHAMRNGKSVDGKKQTIAEAKILADQFVRDQYAIGLEQVNKGNIFVGFYQFGLGLHALQDGTSPAHKGFQSWTGNENLLEKQIHNANESRFPGHHSRLQYITTLMIGLFETKGTLPKKNLFDFFNFD